MMLNSTTARPAHLADNPRAADSYRLLRQAQELRYQVYCVEYSFLCAADYPDGAESDEHDEHAAHFHAIDEFDDLVGYVRLVRPDTDQQFPLSRHCGTSLRDLRAPPAHESVEISRLMVRNEFRRLRGPRMQEVTAELTDAATGGRRRLDAPQVLMWLYRQMYQWSRAHGVRYWYAAMEKPLARALARSSFTFRPIGPETDYYGPVAPYLADLRELEDRVGQERPELLDWMRGAAPCPAPLGRSSRDCPRGLATASLSGHSHRSGFGTERKFAHVL